MKSLFFTFIAAFFLNTICFGQNNSPKKITYSGYAEFYYSYDFSEPNNHNKESYIYNHKRHNEINANLIFAKANYNHDKLRANLSIMYGNYAQYNLSNEPLWAQFINEANIGVKLSKSKNLWLDVGIMPSHIGFESAISADCWTLTRSLCAENSPYYEAGAKLGYTSDDDKVSLNFLVLNGWQTISRPNNYNKPNIGMQATYKPKSNITLNYSNFFGSARPDNQKAFRTFHNLYGIFEATKKMGITAGFDIGTEKDLLKKTNVWYSPVLIAKYKINKNKTAAFRAEYYNDPKQVIIFAPFLQKFQVAGLSANLDCTLNKLAACRFEVKQFIAENKILANNKKGNTSITANLTIKL